MANKVPKTRLKQILSVGVVVVMLVGTFLALQNFNQLQRFFPRADGENANIVVDVLQPTGVLQRPWSNLAQGGEDPSWSLQPLSGQIRVLKPEYIRLDHLYDFYHVVQRDGSGKITYNWSELDAVVNQIVAIGAKPLLSLSYLPPAFTTNGNITGTPSNWGELETLFQRTIERYSRDKGIADVIYEVWNEPDLFGGWKLNGSKNYLTLYATAARAANRAAAQPKTQVFKLGGPATTGLYENWFRGILDFARDNNYRLDFLSWHLYSENIESFVWTSPKPQLG